MLHEQLVHELTPEVSGPVLSPQDAGYDEAGPSTTASSTAGPQ